MVLIKTLIGVIFTTFSLDYDIIKSSFFCTTCARTPSCTDKSADVKSEVKRENVYHSLNVQERAQDTLKERDVPPSSQFISEVSTHSKKIIMSHDRGDKLYPYRYQVCAHFNHQTLKCDKKFNLIKIKSLRIFLTLNLKLFQRLYNRKVDGRLH